MSCSELSLAAGEPLAGTTTRAERWLVLEHPGPWGRDAVADSELSPALAEAMLAYDGRVLLARRPGRRATPGITAFVARTTEDGGDLRRIELARIEDAASVDPDVDGEPAEGPLVLVCVHRRRDACCARLGVPVFNALRSHVPPELLWRSSHQGGHRFAANILALPWGLQLGRVRPSDAPAVASALADGRIPLAHFRGRSLHAPAVQAADAAVRTAIGADRVADVRLLAHDGTTVRLDTPRGLAEVEVLEHAGPAVPPSCGAEPESAPSFVARVVSLGGLRRQALRNASLYPAAIDAGFWELIERTRPASGEVSEHADAVAESLVSMGPDATLAWGASFDGAVDALDHWDLWGALYVALGGCSDDAYLDARCWVVGRGRTAWERARADPEGLLVELYTDPADADDAYDRVGALSGLDGEPLLYAAGRAHERLTGAWRPATPAPTDGVRPRGEPWDEDDLAERFPRLVAVLPEEWAGEGVILVGPGAERSAALLGLSQAFDAACAAFEAGDHATAVARIASVLDDPTAWELAASLEGLRANAAYVGGMCRFILGDADGAAAWLRKGLEDEEVPPHLRRGLAQIELARGGLDAAADLLDDSADASPVDRALRAVVALRNGDAATARARAEALARDVRLPSDAHPWDLAGVHVQLGFVALELLDADGAAEAAEAIGRLTADAPREVPLVPQGQIVLAGALRLRGDLAQAKRILTGLRDELAAGSCDRGLAEREDARCARAAGDEPEAALLYAAAVATFRAAGERWYAEATEAEGVRAGG